MEFLREWQPYLQPSVTLLVGAMAVWIAIQQWEVNKNKLRIDLFDKRYDLYRKTVEFIRKITDGRVAKGDLEAFNELMIRSKFLVGSELYEFLNERYLEASQYLALRMKQGTVNEGTPEAIKIGQEMQAIVGANWEMLGGELNDKFKKYIDLTSLGVDGA